MQAQGLGIGYWELGRDAGTGPDARLGMGGT